MVLSCARDLFIRLVIIHGGELLSLSDIFRYGHLSRLAESTRSLSVNTVSCPVIPFTGLLKTCLFYASSLCFIFIKRAGFFISPLNGMAPALYVQAL